MVVGECLIQVHIENLAVIGKKYIQRKPVSPYKSLKKGGLELLLVRF